MISTIIAKLQADFEAVSEIGAVYAYPIEKPRKFPNIIFFPRSITSNYYTQNENEKAMSFAVFVNHEAKTLGLKEVWTNLMPATVQAVMDKIDAEWNGGVVDGSRVWYTLETGDWTMTLDKAQKTVENVTAELTITIRYIKQI